MKQRLASIQRNLLLLVIVACIWPTASAFAVDGRIEINQASALAGSVTPDDMPGFPVTLSIPGSYVLTGNLTLATGNTDGIEISTSTGIVVIDMNGFAITGPATCTTPCPASGCTAGMGRGIYTSGSPLGISVRNGTVRGLGAAGIDVQSGIRLETVALLANAGDGLRVVGGAAVLDDVTPAFNGGAGINGDTNFPVSARHVIATCNFGAGIRGGFVSRVIDCGAFSSGSDGIAVGFNSLVTGSIATANVGYGINCSTSAAYKDNVLESNGGAGTGNQASPSCVEIGTNLCSGNTTCP